MKRLAITALLLLARALPQDRPVAQLLSRDIYLHEIEPSAAEVQRAKQGPQTQPFDTWLLAARAERLKMRIGRPLMEEFCRRQNALPTDQDISDFADAMSRLNRTPAAGSPASTRDSFLRIGRMWVGAWKFHQALYRVYGGRVIWQQAGIEPIEAYRKFLAEHEAKGSFRIYDEPLRAQFWEYYVSNKHVFVEPKDIDFDTPWWLKPR